MSQPLRLVLREKIYVPVDDPEEYTQELENRYVIDVFNEEGCKDCEFLPDRPCDTCPDCVNYLSRKKLYKVLTRPNGQQYVGFPYGHRSMIPKIIPIAKDLPILDLTAKARFRTALKFTQKLRPEQQEALDVLVDLFERGKLRGMLRAPARTGKTVVAMATACAIGHRTLVLTNQEDLCKQFYETCMGGSNQEAMTNAPQLAKKGVVSVVHARKLEDYSKGDIVISTYQKFITDLGKERLEHIESLFPLVIADEVHRVAAPTFLKVMATMNAQAKLGLTATVTRKDGMHVLNEYVVGPVVHTIETKTMRPRVVFHETGLFPKKDYSMWTYYCRWLERQEDRTDMILKQVMADLKQGRSIVIPCIFRSQVTELVRRINWEYDKKIARALLGGQSVAEKRKRDEALDSAREGKTRVIVGIRSITSTGINVPRWDTLYWINPLSNPPMWVQEYSRILTPMEGKDPIIRMFLDGSGQTRGCLRSCLFKTEGKTASLAKQALIAPEQWAIANVYLKETKKMEHGYADTQPRVKLNNGRLAL